MIELQIMHEPRIMLELGITLEPRIILEPWIMLEPRIMLELGIMPELQSCVNCRSAAASTSLNTFHFPLSTSH